MSWGTCYSGSNNINFNSPPLMNDGRIFSNWQPSNDIDTFLQKENGVKTNAQYRKYLMYNADKIIKYNQLQSCDNCCVCPVKYNTVGRYNGPPQLYDCAKNNNVGYNDSDLKNLYLSKQDLERRAFVPHLTQEQYIKLGYHNYN